jgi:hypothetical protein
MRQYVSTVPFVYIFCTAVGITGASGQLSASSLWKGVAFEALHNIETLQEQLKQHPRGSNQAQFLKCQIMVQSACVMHISNEEIAHKLEESLHAFHILLNGGKDHGLFDPVYVL